MRKKILIMVAAVILSMSCITAYAKDELRIHGPEEMSAGQRIELSVTYNGDEIDADDVTWRTKDSHVAEVDDEGRVKAGNIRKEMIAEIRGKYKGKEAEFDITVKPSVRSINIIRNERDITDDTITFDESVLPKKDKAGKILRLEARCYPEDSSQEVEWDTSDDDVAEVDDEGTVTLVGNGTAYIIARATDKSGEEARIKINVEAKIEDIDIEREGVSDVQLYENGKQVKEAIVSSGEEMVLYPVIAPEEAESAGIIWGSMLSRAIIIDEEGIALAKDVNEITRTRLFARSKSNGTIYDDYEVTVVPKFNICFGNRRINGSSVQLYDSDGYREASLKVEHGFKGNPRVEYKSANSNIVYVDSTGKLFAKAEGRTDITVKLYFNGKDNYLQSTFRVIVRGDTDSLFMITEAMDEVDQYYLDTYPDETKGMTITCIGDSITYGTVLVNDVDYASIVYPKYLESYLKARHVYTMGVGGMPLAREPKGLDKKSWEYYDWNPCVYDILFHDNKNPYDPNKINPNEEYYKQSNLDRLKQSDVVAVICGVNDSLYSFKDEEDKIVRFGSVKDLKEKTFCGDVDRIMKQLKKLAPNAEIMFFTPYHNTRSDKDGMLPLYRYVDAIKEIGAKNNITVVDTFNQNFLNTEDGFIKSSFMPDGIHGNARGNRIIARHVGAWIVRQLSGV